jgi:RimJ/RimL family protein N-acetyltransferase
LLKRLPVARIQVLAAVGIRSGLLNSIWRSAKIERPAKSAQHVLHRTLPDDRLVGDVGLDRYDGHGTPLSASTRGASVKGYGSDAMRVILRYAFTELNLHRVSLNVFEYNPRAVRSYEKVGFKPEGRSRGVLHRAGRRWDLIFMGILFEEWEAQQKNN